MSQENLRTAELKIRSVASQAESLADDMKRGKLWDGDLILRIGQISRELEDARIAANRKD